MTKDSLPFVQLRGEPNGRSGSPRLAEFANAARPGPSINQSPFELARMLDRVNRRFAAFLQAELTRRGITDISPAHAMILCAIGGDELRPAQLHARDPHGGTNSSYYLKQLIAARYIERISAPRDKRSTRVRLTSSGLHVCRELNDAAASYMRFLAHDDEGIRVLEITFQTLHRIEQMWSNTARYGPPLAPSYT